MSDTRRTKRELLDELSGLRERVAELERREREHLGIVEALRDSEDRFRQLFELAPDAYYLYHLDGRFVDGNRSAEQMTGYPREELVGKSFFELDLFSPEELEILRERLKATAQGETGPALELALKRKDGTTVTVEALSCLVRLHGEDLVLGMARDITQRRKAEVELREAESRYRALVENATDFIYLIDKHHRVISLNAAGARLLGGTPEEFTGKPIAELFPAEIAVRYSRGLEQVFKSGEPGISEAPLVTGGQKLWVSVSLSPVKGPSGETVAVMGVSRDITNHKRADEELERYRRRLETLVEERSSQLVESEQKYRAAIEQSLENIYILDFETRRVTEANPAMQRLLGYTSDEMSGLSIYDFIDHPHSDVDERIEKALSEGRLFLGERRYRRREGSRVDVEVSVSRITYGGRSALCVVSRDITERKRAEEALRTSEMQYRSTLDSMGDAIHFVDRDLRLILCNTALKRWNQELGLGTDLVGRAVFDVFPFLPEDVRSEYAQVFTTGRTLVTEETTEVAGQQIITETRKIPVLDDQGTVSGVVTVLRDITERRCALAGLRESEEKYRTLTENVSVGVYRNTVGDDGAFIEANPAMVKMFGYRDRDEFLSVRVSDLYQNPEERRSINIKLLADGFIKDEEIGLRKRDGTPFVGSVSAVAVKDSGGEVVYYDGIVEDVTERKRADRALEQSVTRLRRATEGIIQAMTIAAELRDPYTAGHQRRVTQLACAIARETGLPDERIEGLRMAGLIHDIGKMHVPAEILSRPGRLSSLEFGLIRTHPEVGYDILRSIEFPWPIADIIAQHHERMDGSGYPHGRVGEDVLLEARILAVADVVEAMSSHRPYRPALGIDIALEEVATHQGTLYDPEIVQACLRVFRTGGFRFEDDFSEPRT
jgi:PAS domain S-box-containing protein/putative nucleotidyltransferase with HDIG domain